MGKKSKGYSKKTKFKLNGDNDITLMSTAVVLSTECERSGKDFRGPTPRAVNLKNIKTTTMVTMVTMNSEGVSESVRSRDTVGDDVIDLVAKKFVSDTDIYLFILNEEDEVSTTMWNDDDEVKLLPQLVRVKVKERFNDDKRSAVVFQHPASIIYDERHEFVYSNSKKKHDGGIKGLVLVCNGKPMSKEDMKSPTMLVESIFLAACAGAKGDYDVVANDVRNPFIQSELQLKDKTDNEEVNFFSDGVGTLVLPVSSSDGGCDGHTTK